MDVRPDERIGDIHARILAEALTSADQGMWFEHLFMAVAKEIPEFQVRDIWRWREWPEREKATGLDGRDIGIDLVAELNDGTIVAVQCKCYSESHKVVKSDIDSFINESSRNAFALRWIVATSDWNTAAENTIRDREPAIRRIDFRNFHDRTIREIAKPAFPRNPKPLQETAIKAVFDGFESQGHDRGTLVMACGTGKTYTSLCISEKLVPDDGLIVFAAPTISLVSQTRSEWLTHTSRPMSALVVCSDNTAGGRGARHEAGPDDLVCPVVSYPDEIAFFLRRKIGVKVVFCTYHSLGRVVEALDRGSDLEFNLAIADEAHRTTGVDRKTDGNLKKVDFQVFHRGDRLRANKRLYMTATPRIYSQTSKSHVKRRTDLDVIDMSDTDIYGPEFHRVKFKDAVNAGELSDYRVIVLGVHESILTPAVRRSLETADTRAKVDDSDLARLYGTALAVNGFVRGRSENEVPDRLRRTIAFASSTARSNWFAETLNTNSQLRAQVTRRLEGDERASTFRAVHLEAKHSALKRSEELRLLNAAPKKNEARMICNVRLFAEGVDVPALDAVSFLDPRTSQIDIVQAVGRVMRKTAGKRFGYIIVPVCVPEGSNLVTLLENRGDDYKHVGQVLRALEAHEGRWGDSIANFVIAEGTIESSQAPTDYDVNGAEPVPLQLAPVEQLGIYTHIAEASGLGKRGKVTADTISSAVANAATRLQDDDRVISKIRDVLDLPDADEKETATVAALLACNACLLHKRLKSEASGLESLDGLDEIGRANNPIERLKSAWAKILKRDYEPVFRPALAVLENLPKTAPSLSAIRILATCSHNLADSLNDLGYDHAGPLYHSILNTAQSDGAYYTNNISALMLAGLAFSPNFIDWSSKEAIKKIKVLDPACGTGTLLMAAVKTIKERGLEAEAFGKDDLANIHKSLVESSVTGLDINFHATQLAASNLTLGAPAIEYDSINIHTLQHGPTPDGQVRLGSLELLPAAIGNDAPDLFKFAKQAQLESNPTDGRFDTEITKLADVHENSEALSNIENFDIVLMNPPFTRNDLRNSKFPEKVKEDMQKRELSIRNHVRICDQAAGETIDANSARTFFTPLAEALIRKQNGTLAKVLPVTACISTSGLAERHYLAERFHIEIILTSHDPKHPNFSENTAIHECLLICRKLSANSSSDPTRFIALNTMPKSSDEVVEWLEAVHIGTPHRFHSEFAWPRDRIAAGDWTPAQYYDGRFSEIAGKLDNNPALSQLGHMAMVEPDCRSIRAVFVNPSQAKSQGAFPILWNHKTSRQQTMNTFPDSLCNPKSGKQNFVENSLWPKASRLLISVRINPQAVRTSAVYFSQAALGQAWIPVSIYPINDHTDATLRAWCAWLNSTPGVIGFMNRRQKKLTYASYSLAQLRSLPCPNTNNTDLQPLVDAFEDFKNIDLRPWPEMNKCPVRSELDEVASVVAQLDPKEVADWRERLVREPTISNKSVFKNEPHTAL